MNPQFLVPPPKIDEKCVNPQFLVPPPTSTLQTVNNVHTHANDENFNVQNNYVRLYEEVNNSNVHQFAAHATYNPQHRYSTLTFVCQIVTESNLRMPIRVMIDNGSNLSILRRSVADRLNMAGERCDLSMSVTGANSIVFKKQKKVSFRLANTAGTYLTDFVVEAATAPKISTSFERITVDPKDYTYLCDIEFTEPLPMSTDYFEQNKNIDLLLGLPYEIYVMKFPYYIVGPLGQPSAVLTHLGNCISFSDSEYKAEKNYTYLCNLCENDIPYLENFFKFENLGIESSNPDLTYDEWKMDEILDKKTVYFEETNHYRTVLPWKDDPIKHTNRKRAWAAGTRFALKYSTNKEKWNQMQERIQFMLKNNFIELVPDCDMEKTQNYHYIIAFPVWKDESSTHKCRIVYQANQKMEDGKSLNSHFLTGKNNLPLIPQLLMKFRTHNIAAVADISSFFNRFTLSLEDSDFLRFFFALKKPKSKNEKVELLSFRNRCLPFGLNCSPSVATYLLQRHANKYLNTEFHQAALFITRCTYVDDLAFGCESVTNMKKLVRDIKYIFDQCGLPTHKYFSPNEEVLESLEEELKSKDDYMSVLGTRWCRTDDTLSFNCFQPPTYLMEVEEDDEEPIKDIVEKSDQEVDSIQFTKRMLASITAKIFDVSGFISPYVLLAKKLLQETWIRKCEWDRVLPEDLLLSVQNFAKDLRHLKDVKIPRKIVPTGGKLIELCVFSDACALSFGTTVYAISVDPQGNRYSNLIFAKSKVRSLNKDFSELASDLTIPRMELLACYIGSTAGNFCLSAFKEEFPDIRLRLFTDSLVNLYRINNDPTQYKVWVANRLIHIQKTTRKEDWFFCPGELNFCGDIASRGGKLSDFVNKTEWLQGPSFLLDPNHQYITVEVLKLSQAQKQIDAAERKKVIPTFHHAFVSHHLKIVPEKDLGLGLEGQILASKSKKLDFYEANVRTEPKNIGILYRKSKWPKVVRIFGFVLRYVKKLQIRVATRKKLEELKLKSEKYKTKLRRKGKNVPTSVKKEPKALPKLKMLPENKIVYDFIRLTSEEVIFAEMMLFRYCQFTSFSKQISCLRNKQELQENDILFKLMPFWSEDERILRIFNLTQIGTNQIVLPKGHRVGDLYIKYIHTMYNHSSIPHTMTRINQRVHIIGCRQEIKKVLRCCECKSPIPLHQRISTLPPIDYLNPSKVGYFIQIDFAGPHMVLNEAGELVKTWSCIFMCLVSRLITVKLLKSCSTRDLILGIRSYIAQRGAWQVAYSDSATYFHKASKELKSILSTIKWGNVSDEVLTLGMEWNFNVPKSPHRTGAVESMIKQVKLGLLKSIKNEVLDYVKLGVVFDEISAIINSRPLGYVSSGENSADKEIMVTPAMLYCNRNFDVLPIPVKNDDIPTVANTPLQKIFHAHRTQLSVFWKTFHDVYFNMLKYPKKWHKTWNHELKPGTFILVKEPNLKKFEYKTGRIVSTIKSKDGLVRTVEIKFAQNKKPLLRDLKNCALLEHDYLKLVNDSHTCFYSNQTHWISSPTINSLTRLT